jgi:uncharacterized damage-inducible protein DinB
MLSDAQTLELKQESLPGGKDALQLADDFRNQVAIAITQLKTTDVDTLTDGRGVGRKQIPSTVIGLLFHAAEHIQRHVGQLIVTARILKAHSRVEVGNQFMISPVLLANRSRHF